MNNELIAGIILMAIGVLFFFNNKAMGVGCANFYRKLYTKKSMPLMFKIAGVLLFIAGVIVLLK